MSEMVAGKDRIVLLDAVRGLAVLGILICNAPDFAYGPAAAGSLRVWPHGQTPPNLAEWAIVQTFFQQRFYTLFSMMFGVSMLLVGGERLVDARDRLLLRRLIALAPLAAIHGFLIWCGDVLAPYVAAGLLVFAFRGLSGRRLLALGILAFLAFFAWEQATVLGRMAQLPPPPPGPRPPINLLTAPEVHGYLGGFLDSLRANIADERTWLMQSWVYVIDAAPLMLIGMGLFKLGLFTGEAPRGVYLGFIAAATLGLLVTGLGVAGVLIFRPSAVTISLMRSFQELCASTVGLGYLSLLALALTSRWSLIPRLLAPVGQMAFTNYIAQSILMTAIFYGGRGLGLFGRVDPWALGLMSVGVWALQIAWSHAWLRYFEMGPLEWVWRALYRGPKRMRRLMPAPEVVPA